MLLRSASTPILNSWMAHSKDPQPSPPEPEFCARSPIAKTRSISLSASPPGLLSSPSSFSSHEESVGKMTRALSETDLRQLAPAVPKRKPVNTVFVEEEEETESLDGGFFLGSNGLGENCAADGGLATLLGGDGAGGCGGRIGSGGGGGSPGRGGDGSSDSWDANYKAEVYYETMIDANPGNSLLLGNYAKFLKEVRLDFVRAEEYCGRAILANPNDGDVLSMYADLIWQSHKDSSRAESYFDRAVKAAPEDCYVLASYARFLWDSEEEEEQEEEEERGVDLVPEMNKLSSPNYFHGIPPLPPPLAAAS